MISDRTDRQRASASVAGDSPISAAPTTIQESLAVVEASPLADAKGVRFLLRGGSEPRISWRQLIREARGVAAALVDRGVLPGDRVALFFRTEPDFLKSLLGVQLAGAAPVPLYPPVRLGRRQEYAERTARLMKAAGVRMALGSVRMKRLLRATRERYSLALGLATPEDLAAGEEAILASRGQEPKELIRSIRPTDLGLIQFSSGTTGDPKPVALSHRALLWQAELLGGFWPDREAVEHSVVSWLPLYHDMGLIGCVLPSLLRPADLTLLSPEQFVARPASWLQAISRYRATVSAAPNFAYSMCADRIRDDELEGVDLGSWQAALNGAEAVSPRALRSFGKRFAAYGFRCEALTPVYGLAEAALAVTFSSLDRVFHSRRFDRGKLAEGKAVGYRAPAAPGESQGGASEVSPSDGEAAGLSSIELASVGKPVPGFEIEVRGKQRELLPEGGVGRVWVRGPSLMDGYLDRPNETREILVDGWLDTGDLGFLFDGDLFLCGRVKDVLVLQGRNWAPEPVEEAMARVEGIEPGGVVAVTALPEDGEREELWVLAEVGRFVRSESLPGAGLEAESSWSEEGRRRILAETGLLATRVFLLEPGSLPRTSSGKLQRRRALELLQAGDLVARDEPRSRANARSSEA